MSRLLNIVFALICLSVPGMELRAFAQNGSAPVPNSTTEPGAPAKKNSSPDASAGNAAAAQNTKAQDTNNESAAAGGAKSGNARQGQGIQSAKQATAATPVTAPYVIGPLDVLMIKVWNNANLTQAYDVRSDGMLSMPLIGEVKADGLTVAELEAALAKRLEEFITNPEVNVQVAKVNSKRYFVYGEVLRQGEFPLVEATTVMDALANVGGFKDFANSKKIYVMRGAQRFNFNYKDVSKGKNLQENILLQNGDRIYVP